MKVLVTGAKGMVGTALCNNLKNIRDGKNKTRPEITIEEIYEYDLGSTPEELDEYCQKSDFVFNLAGVNRPENPEDFMKGNFGFASELLNCLKKHNNKARQGINGYLYKPGDSKSMACAIIEYLTDDEKRLKAGRESVDVIRELYSLQQNIDKLERVYTEVERLRNDKLLQKKSI